MNFYSLPITQMESSEVSFQYELWKDSYFEEHLKDFPCPNCRTGRLSLKEDTLSILEPAYSQNDPNQVEGDSIERFIGFLQCNNSYCGEFSAISGWVERTWDFCHERGEFDWERKLQVKNIYPAPPIILLPNETPKPVKQEIEKSFALFWNDKDACANSLRKGIERLLDEQNILSFKEKKNGEKRRLSLEDRIKEFEQKKPEYSDILRALKIIGNIGSHQANSTLDNLLEAFDMYEHTLAELYGNRSAKIKQIATKYLQLGEP